MFKLWKIVVFLNKKTVIFHFLRSNKLFKKVGKVMLFALNYDFLTIFNILKEFFDMPLSPVSP